MGWEPVLLLASVFSVVACGARTELLLGAGPESAGGAPALSTRCELEGDDPRVDGIKPDEIASLDGADFVIGDVRSYHWTLQAEDCDAIVPNAQFTLQGADSQVVKFQPSRPAFYHFALDVVGVLGDRATCKLEVPVKGVGLRVELCWDTSTSTDLDLYLHNPFDQRPWFTPGSPTIEEGLDNTTCNTSNAAAELRVPSRVSWDYEDSALGACNTPAFQDFVTTSGRCPNPRAADDNNQSIANGTTERMQLDNPRHGQTFRAMVQNFNNFRARPHVFVYCDGQRAGAFDGPSTPPSFVASSPGTFGVMWRAADITTVVDAGGKVSCDAVAVANGVTIDDSSF
jgi:hypothetical protein